MDTDNWYIEDLFTDITDWASETFGEENINTLCGRLADEVIELTEEPDDPNELADILILCIWYANLKGWDVHNIMDAKFKIIKSYDWIKGENGHYYREK